MTRRLRLLFPALLALLLAAFSAKAVDQIWNVNFAPPGGAVPGQHGGAPLTAANSVEAKIGYSLSAPQAKFIISLPGVPYVHEPKMVIHGGGPKGTPQLAQTERFSVVCKPGGPASIPVHQVKLSFVSLTNQVLYETVEKVSYTFTCAVIGTPPSAPDLQVALSGPAAAKAGDEIGPLLKLVASNAGSAPAPGTTGALDPAHGYMIDVVLSRDTIVPPGFATYSPSFSEDVLLQGGRVSNTQDLAPVASRSYTAGAKIPVDTPSGPYHVCAQIDPGKKVVETNEANNVSCFPIRITGRN
jgi:hypothetical protein